MAILFASGDVLAASDLNNNTVQPVLTNAMRVQVGTTAFSFAAVNAINQAITWTTMGTFIGAIFSVQSASSVDLIGGWLTTSPPGVSGGTVRLANWQISTQTSPVVTVSGFLHWAVFGT